MKYLKKKNKVTEIKTINEEYMKKNAKENSPGLSAKLKKQRV